MRVSVNKNLKEFLQYKHHVLNMTVQSTVYVLVGLQFYIPFTLDTESTEREIYELERETGQYGFQ